MSDLQDYDDDQVAQVAPVASVQKAVGSPLNAKGLLAKLKASFDAVMGRDPDRSMRFTRMAVSCLQFTPALQQCDELSFVLALMACAEMNLMPGPTFGHAYLVPFGDKRQKLKKVVLIPGYKGLVTCAYRSNQVISCNAGVVYPQDDFEWEEGDSPRVKHRPGPFDPLAEVMYAYACVRIAPARRGGTPGLVAKVLDRARIDSYRNRSRAGREGPWVTDYPPMAMKTAFKRCTPWIPMSYELGLAVAADARDEVEPEAVKKVALDLGGFVGKTGADPMAHDPLIEATAEAAGKAASAPPRAAPPREPGEEPPEPSPALGRVLDLLEGLKQKGVFTQPMGLDTMDEAALERLEVRLKAKYESA